MTQSSSPIQYPRKRFHRWTARTIGRIFLPLLFQIQIKGKENFPDSGPLLVVGNHTAAMEAVLLNIYSPWQIEMLSAADIPAEKITEQISQFYGVIPIHRGSYDRTALTQALRVLDQEGVIGLFPEGGIWQPGKKQAHSGIAWLSYRSQAPVLPIGFNDTTGALNRALKFQRPSLFMQVGNIIAPADPPDRKEKKRYLQQYADRVMDAVHQLVPDSAHQNEPEILEENFQLEISVRDQSGKPVNIPSKFVIAEPEAAAKFLHRPAILKIFRFNLELPTSPLENLHQRPAADVLQVALESILNYLSHENPHLLTYRFGIQDGLAMQKGMQSLAELCSWAAEHQLQLHIKPIRKYYSVHKQKQITQVQQEKFSFWM